VRLIGADEVSTVYSYSFASLSRSLPDFRALVYLGIADKTGTRFEANDLPA
jgi:hypothetical protein